MRLVKLPVICISAIILNFLSSFIFYRTLHLPLFMDTIFSIAVLFYAGLVPALIVQISYNLINSIIWMLNIDSFDIFIPLYTFCGIFIVISSYIVYRRKEEAARSIEITVLYLILIAMISSFCSVLIGGTIDYFHLKYQNFPDTMNPIKNFTKAFVRQRFSLYFSCIVAQIPISITDRLIATFAGYGIYKLFSKFEEKKSKKM
ncbi:MAG: hypothetical protein K5873_11630 [Treponema sp.]|nr:hypothetical protein [Treponema sp.]